MEPSTTVGCAYCQARRECVFCRLVGEARRGFRAIAIRRRYEPGKGIVRQGDAAAGLYVVQYGVVRLFHVTADGKEAVVRLLQPGDMLGLVEVITGRSHSASAETVEASRFEYLPRSEFQALLQEYPAVALRLLEWCGRRLHQLEEGRLETAVKTPLEDRLLENLLVLSRHESRSAPSGEVELSPRLTTQDLAHGLGCSRQWTSKLLKNLESAGLIHRRGRRIILSAAALKSREPAFFSTSPFPSIS